MFGKKCSKCSRKVKKGFDFCPFCGTPFIANGDYGLLGKNDDISELNKLINSSKNSSFMEKLLNNALKMLDKELKQINEQEVSEERKPSLGNINSIPGNFQLYINGKRVNLPGESMKAMPQRIARTPEQKPKEIKIKEEIIMQSAKLPRKEAKTKLTRLKDKVVYELETPGLEDVHNVLINKLESSLEVKAYAKKAVYYKNLAVKLPLMRYGIKPEEGKLFLEFKV